MIGAAGLIARYALHALLLAALVLPFVGGFPLAYVIVLLAIILMACWLSSRPRWAELTEPSGGMLVTAFCFVAAALAITAERAGDILFVFNFLLFALYPLLRAALARFAWPGASLRVAQAALAGALLSLAVAIWQAMTAGRATGIASDPIWSAQSAVVLGFLALIGMIAARGALRYLFLLGPVSGLLTAVLTGSRGPMLAALPMVLVALLLLPGRSRLALLGLAVAAALAVVPASLLYPPLEKRLSSTQEFMSELVAGAAFTDHSVAVRRQLWVGAVDAFGERPLFGHGWDRRVEAVYDQLGGGEAVEAMDDGMRGNRHLHADLLDFGVGAGALGLLAYFLALLAPVAGALRPPHDGQSEERRLGTALLSTAFLACGLSYVMLGYEFPTALYIALAAVLTGYCRDRMPA